jgi:hypothetical protein
MVQVRCAEQMSAMLLFQTMPAFRANLCADGYSGVRLPTSAPASRFIELVALRAWANEGVHSRVQGQRASERNRVASFSRS